MTELKTLSDVSTASIGISRELPATTAPEIKRLSLIGDQKKLVCPFANDREGCLVYAPEGLYGASYYVPDSKTRERIQRKWSTAGGVLMVVTVLMRPIDLLCEKQPWALSESMITLIVVLLGIFWNIWVVASQSNGLAVARQRPSPKQMCQIGAANIPASRLWCSQIGAIVFALLFTWCVQHPYGKSGVVGYIVLLGLILASIAVACVCSYMLNLKQRLRGNARAKS